VRSEDRSEDARPGLDRPARGALPEHERLSVDARLLRDPAPLRPLSVRRPTASPISRVARTTHVRVPRPVPPGQTQSSLNEQDAASPLFHRRFGLERNRDDLRCAQGHGLSLAAFPATYDSTHDSQESRRNARDQIFRVPARGWSCRRRAATQSFSHLGGRRFANAAGVVRRSRLELGLLWPTPS
jgi:hypothetical protein